MPLHHHSPFDREFMGELEPSPEPDWRPHAPLIAAMENGGDLPRRPRKLAPPARRHWWGLCADCCHLIVKAGIFLMTCWVIAMGLPLMFLLLLCMGQLDMAFLFLGSLFGSFVDAAPDRQYAFAHQASWVLVALATVVAAWRLPRFLNAVSQDLSASRKAS